MEILPFTWIEWLLHMCLQIGAKHCFGVILLQVGLFPIFTGKEKEHAFTFSSDVF